MKLHNLKRSTGLQDKSKRLGRGNGSGKGNYSGKGHKGQKARSGYSKTPGFEGGQTSLLMRRPKGRGFKRYYKLVDEYVVINVSDLQNDERILKGIVNKQLLKDLGYIKKASLMVKILGNGEFTKSLDFEGIESFSKTAIDKIEKAGGKILDKKSA
ncbi:MAG: 50S ribosomal protein L15 [Candidatus Absconditicoccaceae bacterium]